MENLLRREEELIHSLMLYIRAKNNLAPGLKNISFKKDVLKELKIQFGTRIYRFFSRPLAVLSSNAYISDSYVYC